MPHELKVALVREHARRFSLRTFVETGTFHGDMVRAVLGDFRAVYSIELDRALFEKASRRFAREPAVRLRSGDSAAVLPQVVREVEGPCLFWLDAHYSGEGTARAVVDTPIERELRCLLAQPAARHVILVDDARLFDGTAGYPRMDRLLASLAREAPGHEALVRDDVLRILPRASP
jgi:hypothetical protein